MEINIAKPDSKQFSDSPQPIVRNLNIQTKVFNKDSPLRVSTDTSFQTHSNFSSPSDPIYLTKPVDSASGNSKSPRLDTAVVPTPIFKDLDKDLAKFRRRTNTCIVANNGKEYHGHWTAHYCTGSEEIEGILTIDDNSLVFAATLDLQGEVKTSTFASRLLPFLAKPKETFTKIFGEFEVVINMQDIAECHIMDFPVPCSKHSNKTQKVYLLQLCLTNHGDYSIEKNIDGILLDMKNKKTPYVSLFFNLRAEGDIQESETNKPSETLLKIQSRIENTINSLQAGQGNGIATDVPYFEFLIEKFDTTQRPLLRTAKQVVNENLKLRLKSHKENHKSPKDKLKAPKLSPTLNKEGVKSNPQLLKPKRIVSPFVLDQSSIVSSDQFAQIVSCAPDLYQMFEWKLEYSNSMHGTSYNNLMRRAKLAKPFVIIIRDTSNNVFGAYGSEVLKSSLSYYGTGETFLFTFRKTNDITEYRWSKKNDLFIFANEDGIMFGAGPFYGLWIENELTRGRTYACDTFDNQPLSESIDFQIARIELWSVVDPFSKK